MSNSPIEPKINRHAFAVLAREHHRPLLAYARALTKEAHTSRDIVQDAFVVAWKNLDTFDVTRDFASWMRGIVRNKWRETLRKSSRQTPLDDETLEFLEADARQVDALREKSGVFSQLESCLQKLPSSLADAVRAYYYDEQSSDQAATALSVESSTLRKRLQRARQNLRLCLQKA